MNEIYLKKYREKLVEMIGENSTEGFSNENPDCTQVIIQEGVKKYIGI